MSASAEGPFDLEAIKREIRQGAARKRSEIAASIRLPAASPAHGWTFNWLQTRTVLKAATADSLYAMPTLDRYHGLKRWLARLVARAVLFLAYFIYKRQSHWNSTMREVLLDMGQAFHDMESHVVQQQERIRLLEATISQLQLSLGAAGTQSDPSARSA